VNRSNVGATPQWQALEPDLRRGAEVVSVVLPFRSNRYVMDQLIDWDRVPDDPMYQLTFPQRDMLYEDEFNEIDQLLERGAEPQRVADAAGRIRARMNPQPGGQKTHNVPTLDGRRLHGIQHKYRETLLFFPKRGQTCHAYCTYCFRWAQFIGVKDLRFAAIGTDELVAYLRRHPDVTDVLITGGDPMTMMTNVLARYIEPLLQLGQLSSIRIGTKAPATWPHRFTTGPDADDVLRLFDRVVRSGKHLAIMAHYSHPVELSTELARHAIRRIRSTGAIIRMQNPVAHRINDDPEVWTDLWRTGVRLGCVPYYMFVARDTGPRNYFEVPLARCWEIYQGAYQRLSGLARTVRGPSMSAFPGKVHVLGTTHIDGMKVFVLEYLQARDAALVRRPFFARFDPEATWFDQLEPARDRDVAFF
jgi:L-lysine 2,3-aminomutase